MSVNEYLLNLMLGSREGGNLNPKQKEEIWKIRSNIQSKYAEPDGIHELHG